MEAKFQGDARQLTARIRANPIQAAVTRETVSNLTYLLERAMDHIAALSATTQVEAKGDVVTVQMLNDILSEIGDPDLRAFFTRRVQAALGIARPAPVTRIG